MAKAIELFCFKCGGISFRMRWSYETGADLLNLVLSHDGYGYRAMDSILTCATCGAEAPWADDDITGTRERQP